MQNTEEINQLRNNIKMVNPKRFHTAIHALLEIYDKCEQKDHLDAIIAEKSKEIRRLSLLKRLRAN